MPERLIIGVAGESGVGKTTISNLLEMFFKDENVLKLSTDDLHKWCRGDLNWNEYTHLNPDANNLELGDNHLLDLVARKSIYRSIYNHSSGTFNPPLKINPENTIIIEGLHAFYSDISKKCINLKIFIDAPKELITHWKIIRDTEERNYKYNEVIDTISRRLNDSRHINQKQINCADVVIRIDPTQPIKNIGFKNEEIYYNLNIEYHTKNGQKYSNIFKFISRFYEKLTRFVILNKMFSDIQYRQESGANTSIKVDDLMIIKSSGYKLTDIDYKNGYSIININKVNEFINDNLKYCSETEFNLLLSNSTISNSQRPSLETGFHNILKKYVVHLHPIYLNVLISSYKSEELIQKLYKRYNYRYIKYVAPGLELLQEINKDKNYDIFFLENHGLIVSSDNYSEIISNTANIIDIAFTYLKNNIKNFELFNVNYDISTQYFYFPDAAVFALQKNNKEIMAANSYIEDRLLDLHLPSKILSDKEVSFLQNLECEEYRRLC